MEMPVRAKDEERSFMNFRLGIILFLFIAFIAGCSDGTDEAAAPAEVRLMTHDSFDVSEEVIAAFEAENDASVVVLPSGDAGSALNQAILTKEAPIADVFFGVDNTFLGRALAEDIFVAYDSPLLAEIPDALELDETKRLLPVDVGDVCLNYDKAYFADNVLPVPASLADLTNPIYADLLVVQNPATSSPGLAFLLATIANFGTEGDYTYLDYWADLRANGVLVTNDWTDAYYGQFTVASDGNRPLVVSYATSPPAEVIFADPPVETAPSAAITAPGTCFRQVEFVGILAGTDRPELAQKLVDFMLGETFQEDMPLRMFVFPVNENADLPTEFEVWATIPTDTANLPSAEIDANREMWIEAWREVVLQ
jgi:thiamine transport system substrate-binding protein